MSEVTEKEQGQQQNGAAPEVAYDADAKARDRAKRAYRVDGVLYFPRKKTGRLVMEIMEMAPENSPDENDRAAQLEGVRVLYRQVARLLRDDEGHSPDWERLLGSEDDTDEGLDLEDARAMVGRLMGNVDEDGNPVNQGNVVVEASA